MPEKAFFYQADILCEKCGNAKREELKAAGQAPANPDDERTYDSNDYPKGPEDNGGGEADSYQHCAHCGLFLGNPLTGDGVTYSLEALAEYVDGQDGNTEALDEWADDLADYNLDKDQKFVLTAYREVRRLEKELTAAKQADESEMIEGYDAKYPMGGPTE
jgi:sarcosine oxidase delta subunit